MGKVLKSVKRHEAEKHVTTEEFIGILRWYIQEGAKLDAAHTRAKNDLTEAYNSRIAELKAKVEEEKNG